MFFPLFGFSINTLSLFGLVLAIGLVVDDAIVVVEAVERHIEEGLAPKHAALKAMQEISGPVIGIALVLSAVFVPTAFIPGITGTALPAIRRDHRDLRDPLGLQRPFAQPCAGGALLKPKKESRGLLGKFFAWFNRVFDRATDGYVRLSRRAAAQERLALGHAGRVWRGGRLLDRRQAAFELRSRRRPGLLLHQRPAAQCRFAPAHGRGQSQRIEKIPADTPGVEYTTTIVGFSLLSLVRTSYNAFGFVSMKDWGERTSQREQFQAIKARLNRAFSKTAGGLRPSASRRRRSPGSARPAALPSFSRIGPAGRAVPGRQLNKFLAAAAQAPGDRLREHYLPAERAAAVRHRRPRQSHQTGRRRQRCLPDHPGLHGRTVRQLLQPLRPPVAGLCPGRRRLPDESRERRAVLCAEREWRHGPALRADDNSSRVTGPEFTMRFNQYRGGAD